MLEERSKRLMITSIVLVCAQTRLHAFQEIGRIHSMSIELLEPVVRTVVNRLVDGDYDAVVAGCAVSRLSADDLRQVVCNYGRKFIVPPHNAYHDLDIIAVKGSEPSRWSVRAPLWTSLTS